MFLLVINDKNILKFLFLIRWLGVIRFGLTRLINHTAVFCVFRIRLALKETFQVSQLMLFIAYIICKRYFSYFNHFSLFIGDQWRCLGNGVNFLNLRWSTILNASIDCDSTRWVGKLAPETLAHSLGYWKIDHLLIDSLIWVFLLENWIQWFHLSHFRARI